MRERLKLVAFGIGAAVILTAAGGFLRNTPVETDLTTRGMQELANDALSWAKITIDGRDATLTGTAPTEEARNLALKTVDRVWGIRTVSDETDLFPLQSPYKIEITRKNGAVEMSGFVPKSVARDAIKKAAREAFPDGGMTYNLPLARGAPPKLIEAVEFAILQLREMTEGVVTITDRRVDVSGLAANRQGYDNLLASLEKSFPVGFTIGEFAVKPPVVSPYDWSATLSRDGVLLTGHIPSAQIRQEILEKSRSTFAGLEITDEMMPGSGAPESFAAAASFALAQLAGFEAGTVSLSDLKLSLSGKVDDLTVHDAISAALDGKLPAGMTIAARNIEKPAPPEPDPSELMPTPSVDLEEGAWRVTRAEMGVVIEGAIASEEDRETILSLARSKFGTIPLEDHQVVAEGLPGNHIGAILIALQAVSRLAEGQVLVEQGKVSLSGTAYYVRAAEVVRDYLLETLPTGYDAEFGDLSVRKPGETVDAKTCQDLYLTVLKANKIRFETAKAVISRDSFGLLDRLVFITFRCPESQVEIEGHTDSDGSDEANQQLSEQRAASVMNYLIDAGVAVDRLKAIGYGEGRPVASNDTDDGKALNRRIEFRIVQE